MSLFIKDPDAVLDYRWSWSSWLQEGETISGSEVIAPDGITVDSDEHDEDSATVWLSGGTAELSYPIVNRITTSQGRVDDRTIQIVVRER